MNDHDLTCDGLVHVERPGADYRAAVTHVRMLCGASCVIFDDCHDPPRWCCGLPVPNLDFYVLGRGSEGATCPECRALDHTVGRPVDVKEGVG